MNTFPTTIQKLRNQLGSDLLITAHHYQNDEVIRHADLRGDSLELSQKVAQNTAKHIVFCGVYFMAESAALLAQPGQLVHLPDPGANCVMSQMAPHVLLDTVMNKLKAKGRKIIPLAYVNTSVAVKAVCGKHGGAVCTSANADIMLKWALKQGDGVLFLPDKNLAMNTAKSLNMELTEQQVIDIRKAGEQLDLQSAAKATMLIWPGCCAIHARFNTDQIAKIRKNNPEAKVVVHPECSPSVVDAADSAGSTSHIIKYVEEAKAGSHVVIATEWNLVNRLAELHKGRITVEALTDSSCSHMAKITEEKLAQTLTDIASGSPAQAKIITVPQELAEDARVSLTRMLEACK